VGLLVGMLGHAALAFANPPAWELVSHAFDELAVRVVAIDPQNPQRLYAATERAVYRSVDGGRQWDASFRAPGDTALASLAVDPFDAQHLLVATDRGLYGSTDRGRSWQRLFRSAGGVDSRCHVVAFHPRQPQTVFLGTAGGLLISRDGGHQWQSVGPPLSGHAVSQLAIKPGAGDRVYALADHGLFAGAVDLGTWTHLFRVLAPEATETDAVDDAPEPPEQDAESTEQLTALAIDPHDPQTLYLASFNGAFVSHDEGATWQRLTHQGLGTTQIRHLILHAHSPTVAYAATPQGVARYVPAEARWEILYAGLPTPSVQYLAATPSKIFAATDHGLYMLDLTPEELSQGAWPAPRELLADFAHEPTVGQVQRAAIWYAKVDPEKIQRWHRQAYLKALLPKLSMSYDHNQDTYISSSVTSTATRVFQTEDPSRKLGFSVGWDLGDLIWNTDQTSIDVRSRLMVQLRDNILDDITRTYFERRRLQLDLLTNPPSDPKLQLTKELRLAELTAMLDGLTGGWFSNQLNETR